jgi:hypothetical protein
MRRSADFVFGINQGAINFPKRATLAERRLMSMAALWMAKIGLAAQIAPSPSISANFALERFHQ